MTKDDSKSREPYELFQKRKYRWKLVSDPSFTAAKKRVKLGLDTLDYVPKEESDNEMTIPTVPRALKLPQYNCKGSTFQVAGVKPRQPVPLVLSRRKITMHTECTSQCDATR